MDDWGNTGRRIEDVKRAARQGADRVDTHVHANPNPYVRGAFGLGLVGGNLLSKRPIQ